MHNDQKEALRREAEQLAKSIEDARSRGDSKRVEGLEARRARVLARLEE